MRFSILRIDEALPDLRLRSIHNPEKKDSTISAIAEGARRINKRLLREFPVRARHNRCCSQRPFACIDLLPRPNSSRARDLKLPTMADRFPLFTTIAIVDLGIVPAISQATTEATLFLTADAGRMEIPMPESTRDMSVGICPAVWQTFGTTPASRSIPKIKSWNPGA
jgi:hypothetical protein